MTTDSSNLRCKVCENNNATHMCEDCGTVICAGCIEQRVREYNLCKECQHNLGVPLPGENPLKCPECGSDNLGVGRRTMEVCPHCHSSRIVHISEKKRELAQDMRSAIMSLQYGHTKLREFTNHLVTAKRVLVSLRMANFLHYRWLEEKIEEIHSEFPAIKKRIGNHAEIVAKQMVAETKGLIDQSSWDTTQFPFIEGVVNRITELGIGYRALVEETLVQVRLGLNDVKKQLEGLKYYRRKFSPFYEYSELSVGELPVSAFPSISLAGSDFVKNDKANGTLYITNKRLIFVAETGLVRKKTDIIFDFPLIYLKGFEEDGRIRKRLVLKLKQGDLKINCGDQTKRVLPDYVEIARKFDRYVQTDMQRVRKLEQTDTNVSDIRLRIEGLIYSILNTKQTETRFAQEQDRYYIPYQRDQWPREQVYGYPQSHGNNRQFRDHLEDVISRQPQPGYYTNPPRKDLSSLKREARALDDAIKEAVHMLRAGRIIPEDFIRRYRNLMRDSYYARREIERHTPDRGFTF